MSEPKLIKPDYRRVEREAIGLLNKAWVSDPPVNPVEIARRLGVQVKFVTFSGESVGVSGLYDPSRNAILVNEDDAGVRQTFTAAHELGHKVLHEEWAKSEDYKLLWRDLREGKDRWEKEAIHFAATLLMPREMVDEFKNPPVQKVTRIFPVSEQVAKFRLQNLYGI